MSEQERLTAYHEAGHIVAAYASGLEVGWATIEPTEDALGRAHTPLRDDIAYVWECSNESEDDEYLEKHLVCLVAGAKAEELLTGEEHDLEGTDFERAADFVLHLAGSEEERQLEVSGKAFDEAERLLRRNWHVVERLAAQLAEHRTLSAERVVEIVKGEIHA
ncbi:MAG: hypothetical protein H0U65_08645 [Rubrobacter sp.]|nr:hypothetical protein [Rubrobacter sp.]